MENTPTADTRGHRTLATVVFTDCVGFSAKMSEAEDHTLDLIRRDLKLMRQVCEQYDGRVLKSTGDGLLMHFISAVKAVECAVEIQQRLTEIAANLAPEDTLMHRIGIHLADMFITDTDVMGNGVNIAARLQAEAEPGGICLSQTVYDVVKAGLQLPTQYLGLRELKNIREGVPVYRILLQPDAELINAAALGEPSPTWSALQHLSHHRNLARIKKLLFYTCNGIWESDSARLDALNLEELLQSLLTIAPLRDRLDVVLENAVKTLSKPAEYAVVASQIAQAVEPIYAAAAPPMAATDESSEFTKVLSVASDLPQIYEQLAQSLERSPHIARIQKLLFYVCRKRWESEPQRLNVTPIAQLIAELHQAAPTQEQLWFTMSRFVQTLSKQAEYAAIADAIVKGLQPLYPPSEDATLVNEAAEPESTSFSLNSLQHRLEQDPNLPRIKKLLLYVCRQQWETDTGKLISLDLAGLLQEVPQTVPTLEQLESQLNVIVKTLSKPTEYGAIARTLIAYLAPLYTQQESTQFPGDRPTPADPDLTVSPPVLSSATPLSVIPPAAPAPVSPAAPVVPQPASSSFDSAFELLNARLGIMKYTNPLRAKIVLFSALQGDFGFSSQDWLNLRMQELDGLLRKILAGHQVYTDLEAVLYAAARRLNEPEIYVQVTDTVLKCLRSFYLHGSAASFVPPGDDTQLDFNREITELEFDDAIDQTHQLVNGQPSSTDDCTLPGAVDLDATRQPAVAPSEVHHGCD